MFVPILCLLGECRIAEVVSHAHVLPALLHLPPLPNEGPKDSNIECRMENVNCILTKEAESDDVFLTEIGDIRREVWGKIVAQEHFYVLTWSAEWVAEKPFLQGSV
jgi:hypothetical protein